MASKAATPTVIHSYASCSPVSNSQLGDYAPEVDDKLTSASNVATVHDKINALPYHDVALLLKLRVKLCRVTMLFEPLHHTSHVTNHLSIDGI